MGEKKMYVYCPRKSDSARSLTEALGGERLRRFDGMNFWVKGKRVSLEPGSVVVSWGHPLPDLDQIRVINGANIGNKFKAVQTLSYEGVDTVQVSSHGAAPHDRFLRAGYLPRSFNHVGGGDLLTPNPHSGADYYSLKIPLAQEYRLHVFFGKSIRAGVKVPREGFMLAQSEEAFRSGDHLAHPWIRSFDAGWRILYDDFKSSLEMRHLAKTAVSALKLDFGAVDIGKRVDDNHLVVLEVNRAPGAEGGTLEAYAKHLKKLIEGADGDMKESVKERKVKKKTFVTFSEPDPVVPPPVSFTSPSVEELVRRWDTWHLRSLVHAPSSGASSPMPNTIEISPQQPRIAFDEVASMGADEFSLMQGTVPLAAPAEDDVPSETPSRTPSTERVEAQQRHFNYTIHRR